MTRTSKELRRDLCDALAKLHAAEARIAKLERWTPEIRIDGLPACVLTGPMVDGFDEDGKATRLVFTVVPDPADADRTWAETIQGQRDRAIDEVERLTKQRDEAVAFAVAFIRVNCWDGIGDEPDGGDVQDMAEKHGLIVAVPGGFDPDKHDDNGWGAERGDPYYTVADWVAEIDKEAR